MDFPLLWDSWSKRSDFKVAQDLIETFRTCLKHFRVAAKYFKISTENGAPLIHTHTQCSHTILNCIVFTLKRTKDYQVLSMQDKAHFSRLILTVSVLCEGVDDFYYVVRVRMRKYTHLGKSLSSAAGTQGENFQVWLCFQRPAFALPRTQPVALERPNAISNQGNKTKCKEDGRVPSTPLTTTAQVRNPKLLSGCT